MRKTIILFVAAFMLVALAASCSREIPETVDENIKIGFIAETFTVERWEVDRDIFVAKARELGAEVIVQNAYENSERQIEIIRDMVSQGVDALVIIAYEKDALADAVEFAKNNGVIVIAYDRLILNANVDLYITFDNVRVGQLMGEEAVKVTPEGRYLILNGAETDNNAYYFREGYMGVLTGIPGIEIIDETWIADWRDEEAYQYVWNYLETGGTMDAIIAANDRVADGAVRALSEFQLAGLVPVTGQDAELGACRRIVEGTQLMTVYKPIRILAEGAAKAAFDLVNGRALKGFDFINDGSNDVKYIEYTPLAVTKENINETVILDGVYTVDQVYRNIPEDQRP